MAAIPVGCGAGAHTGAAGQRRLRRAGNVPLEFIGLARRYRTKIADAHAIAEHAERLIAPFRPRPGFEPWPQRAMLERLTRRWRALPSGNRVPLATWCDDGKLEIADLWLQPARLLLPGWDNTELALSLSLRVITIAPPAFSEESLAVATVGLHAIARRFERGAGRDDAAILRDLVGLAPGYVASFRDNDVEIEDGGDFAIPAPGGGLWIGAATSERECPPVLAVRTFIANRGTF